MKKASSILLSILLVPLFSLSQGCLPDGFIFNTQEQIDNFPSNYPECTEFEGFIRIMGEDILNLDSLYPIERSLDRFSITECPNLISLNGLSNLTNVYKLAVTKNVSLKNLDGLENLQIISGGISIEENPSMENIDALYHLTRFDGNLTLSNLDFLIDLSGFSNLEGLGCLSIKSMPNLINLQGLEKIDSLKCLMIMGNPMLQDLQGLDNIKYILSGTSISYNPKLRQISLPKLKQSGGFYITSNDLLQDLNGLEQVENISGDLTLLHNDQMENAFGMDNLKTIESIEITSCPRLKNINGFPNLKKIHQRLKISSNDSLLDITAFNKLDSIGSIGISNNQRLQSINGFQNLKHIDWGLTISSNSVLADINNFQSLHTISSNVDISSNDILQNIHAFSKLQTINGNIKITNNKSMEFINSFNKLEFINGDFSIQQCKELIEINGFELLKHIGGSVEISSNFNLQTITALNSIKHIYKSISISSNKVLVNLNGLHNIDSIDGNLIIKNLLDIQNLEGLEKLKHVGGTFLIENGIELRSFNGLGNITEANTLIIKNNNNLQDISALRSLRLIKSKLSIINNKTIENLHGLENLSIINGSLGITGNNTLNSIDGIKNAIINGRLFIYQNKDLAICDCESICDFINSHQSYEYMIHSNATGCDSPEEISEACQINGFYNPDVFPLIDVNPNWNLLQSTYSIPNRTVTKSFSYTNNYTVCYKQYSKINFPDINQRAYIRSNHEKTYYRRNEDCLKKEYLLYDYTLEVGDTAWLGWNQYEWMSKDTAAFVLESIDTVKQFGVNHRRFHMVYAEEDQAFNGSLKWIEGIGSEIHPFYPFGLLSESLMTEYNLLCYDSSSVQLYQNPLFNTCDSNYIAIEEIEKNGLIIAPNPFQNQTTIKSPQEKILQVKVYSITGKLMQDFSPDNQHSVLLTFDQDTPQGIYLLQVITDSKMIQRKILRQ